MTKNFSNRMICTREISRHLLLAQKKKETYFFQKKLQNKLNYTSICKFDLTKKTFSVFQNEC